MKSCVVSKERKSDVMDTLSKVTFIFLSVSTPESVFSDQSTDTQTRTDDSNSGYEAEESSSPSNSPEHFISSSNDRMVDLNSQVGLPAPHHDWSGNADGSDNYWRTAPWRHWDTPHATHGIQPQAQSALPSDFPGQSALSNVTCYENVTSYQAAQRPLMASVDAYSGENDVAPQSKRLRLDSSTEQFSTSDASQSSIVAESMDERSIANVGDSANGQGQDTEQDQKSPRELRTLDPSTPEYFKYAWFYPMLLQRAASQAAESQAAGTSVAPIDHSSGNFDVTFGGPNSYVEPTRAPEQEVQSSTMYTSYPSWFEQTTHTAPYEAGMEQSFIEPSYLPSDSYLQDYELGFEATRSAYLDLQRNDPNDWRACLDEARPAGATQTFAGANFLPSSDVSPQGTLRIPTLPLSAPLRAFLVTHNESQSPALDNTSSNEAVAKRQPYIESIRDLMKKAMSGKPILQKKPRRLSTRPKEVIDIPAVSRDCRHQDLLPDHLKSALRQGRAEYAVIHLEYPLELSNEEKASAVERLKANLGSFLDELRRANCQFTNIYPPCQNDFFLTAHETDPERIYVKNILGMLAHMVDQYSDRKEVSCDDRIISIVPRNYLCVTTPAQLQGAWELWSVLSKYVTVKGVKGKRCLLSWSEIGRRAFWRMYVKWTGLVIGDKDREDILIDAFTQAGLHKMLLASILDSTYRKAGSAALWDMSFEPESDEARETFEMLIATVDRLITDGPASSTVSTN